VDLVDHGKGLSIPVNADPSALNGGGDKAAADASAGAGPAGASRVPGDAPASDTADDASTSDNGGAGVDDASAAFAAPAVVPIPPARPVHMPVVARPGDPVGLHPKKAGEALASSGAVFVQLSAQKSANAAKSTYHDLQAKFPTIFGKLDPHIQRADLGDKVVYYRLRIGPFASAEAQKVCGSYQVAGGNCFIAPQ
jgi:hypothetical protein